MVAGDPHQAFAGHRDGGCQRHPNLGSDPRHPPRDLEVEEDGECRRAECPAGTRSPSAADELRVIHPDPAGNCVCTCIIIIHEIQDSPSEADGLSCMYGFIPLNMSLWHSHIENEILHGSVPARIADPGDKMHLCSAIRSDTLKARSGT